MASPKEMTLQELEILAEMKMSQPENRFRLSKLLPDITQSSLYYACDRFTEAGLVDSSLHFTELGDEVLQLELDRISAILVKCKAVI